MHFSCECGYAREWTPADDRQHRGTFFPRAELEDWLDDAAEKVASFAEALASGRRDDWFDEPGHPSRSRLARHLSDAGVVRALMRQAGRGKGVGVRRCSACGRIGVEDDGRPSTPRHDA